MEKVGEIRTLLSKIHKDRNRASHVVYDRDLKELKICVDDIRASVDSLEEIVNSQIENK